MDDFMDKLLREELSKPEQQILDDGFSAHVLQHVHKNDTERLGLIIGSLIAGLVIALISVPDIFSIISTQINSIAIAGISAIGSPDTQSIITQFKQVITGQLPLLIALGVALMAPMLINFLED